MTILYVFPHPDDESFGPGPAIAKQRREGHAVHLLTLTEGGATTQRHRLGLSVEEMGDIRRKEMDCVADALDLSSLTVLDLPDGGLKHLDPRDIERVIEERVEAVRPDVLVTYAVHGISGHPDHLVGHAVVKRLFCRLRDEQPDLAPQRLAFFTLADGDDDMDRPAHLKSSDPNEIGCLVQFTEEDLKKGHAALDCYETYADVVEAHQPLDQVADGVAFVLFQEEHDAPLDSLTADLHEEG
jgi:LmbE family N-acetylglucosaminyl deacetylase